MPIYGEKIIKTSSYSFLSYGIFDTNGQTQKHLTSSAVVKRNK